MRRQKVRRMIIEGDETTIRRAKFYKKSRGVDDRATAGGKWRLNVRVDMIEMLMQIKKEKIGIDGKYELQIADLSAPDDFTLYETSINGLFKATLHAMFHNDLTGKIVRIVKLTDTPQIVGVIGQPTAPS